jgi:hypothetical protein
LTTTNRQTSRHNLEAEVKQALNSPDEIRRSSRDPNLLLFYLILKEKRWVVAESHHESFIDVKWVL